MGRVKEGGKAGLIAGVIYALVVGVVVAAFETAFKSGVEKVIISEFHPGSTADLGSLYSSTVVGSVAVAVIFGIILGVVLGLIFGAYSGRIPGKSVIVKGLVLGFVLWLILHALADTLNLKYGVAFYITDVGLGLATSLLYGYLLGLFFVRGTKLAMKNLPIELVRCLLGTRGQTWAPSLTKSSWPKRRSAAEIAKRSSF